MGPNSSRKPIAELPRAGDVVAGKYAIVRVIGEGGMGIVFEATHQRLRQRVALKMLLPEMLKLPILITRFEREARAAAQLKGRNVARVMDVDVTADGLPYMVMELLEGHDLQVELERRDRLPLGESVDYVLQTCMAMNEAHALGIVHRDLKPSNLFLTVDDTGVPVVKVLDFGISKLSNDGDATLTGSEAVIGTALYMSPEQVRASGKVDARSDVWALGVILYELLSGRTPWLGTPTQVAAAIVSEPPPALDCGAPPEIGRIVSQCLERNPDERFATVKELAYALAPFAPAGSLGRGFVDALSAPSKRRALVDLPRPALPNLALTPAPHAASAASSARSGVRDGGTAPGWTGASEKVRGRAYLTIAVAALFGLAAAGTVFLLKVRRDPGSRLPVASAANNTTAVSTPVPLGSSSLPPIPSLEKIPEPPATTSAEAAPPSSAKSRPAKTPRVLPAEKRPDRKENPLFSP